MPQHHRSPDEYVRPAAQLDLSGYCTHDRAIFVAGVFYHQKALANTNSGQEVLLELVPEPRNRWDALAVALDLDGQRVGYMQSNSAIIWHDVVRAWNRAGYALHLPATVNYWGESNRSVGLTLRGITWTDLDALAHAGGLHEKFLDLLERLTPAQHEGLTEDNGYTPAKVTLRALRGLREDFEQFTWQRKVDDMSLAERSPFWIRYFVRDELRRKAQHAGLIARVRSLTRKRIQETARAQREAERNAHLAHGPRAVELRATGMPKAAIARSLSITEHQVRNLLAAEQPQAPASSHWHLATQHARTDHARQALAHQRAGLTRSQIAARMGRSDESVKQLLSDAKFYESPTSSPDRYELANRCIELRTKGLSKSDVLATLGTTTFTGLRAYRDATFLKTTPAH